MIVGCFHFFSPEVMQSARSAMLQSQQPTLRRTISSREWSSGNRGKEGVAGEARGVWFHLVSHVT